MLGFDPLMINGLLMISCFK